MATGKLVTTIRVNGYGVVSRAVEEGVAYAITRLFKHAPAPMTEEYMRDQQGAFADYVMNALSEVLQFNDLVD